MTRFPREGVVRWSWRTPSPLGRPDTRVLEGIPGVKVVEISPTEGFVEVHESAWITDAVTAFANSEKLLVPMRQRLFTVDEHLHGTASVRDFGLFPHQLEGVEYCMQALSGVLVADEVGLGKTRQSAVVAHLQMEELRATKGTNGFTLITGPAYVRAVWQRELRALGLLRDEADFLALASLNANDPEIEARMRLASWWFCHYDILQAWTRRIQFNKAARRPLVLILDEAHNVRNPKSKRGDAAKRIAEMVPFRLVLTGTPFWGKPSDLHNLLVMVDGRTAWGTHYEFRTRYCGAYRDEHGVVDGEPTNTQELQERLAGRYLARTKVGVGLSLPPITRAVFEVDKPQDFDVQCAGLLRHYRVELSELMRLLASGGIPSEEVLRALHALRQQTAEAKLPTTVEHVSGLVEQGQSVLVFVQERKTAEAIARRVGGETRYVHGGLAQDERDAHIDWMQQGLEDGVARVLVATYGALREGVTLTACTQVVHHDLDWTPSVIFQAEARAYRIGTRGVTTHWMVVRNSIDTLFAAKLVTKAARQSQMLGASEQATTLDELGLGRAAGVVSFEEAASAFVSAWEGALT